MRKSSVKKLLITVTLVMMLAVIATNVQATIVNPLNIQGLGGNTTTNTTTNTNTNINTNNNTNKVNTTTNTVKVNTTTNTAVNNNTNLPQTGDASDYVIFLFIAVCTVVGVYAYRNYRNYNI